MVKQLIESLFPQGQRKVIVSLIAVTIGAIIHEWGGGLTDPMVTALIAVVAIFTGGNVLEHLSDVFKPLKGTKIGKYVEDVLPGDQGLKEGPEAEEPVRGVTDFAPLEEQVRQLSQQMQTHAQNTAQIVNVINNLRGQVNQLAQAFPPQVPPPPRPPAPVNYPQPQQERL